MNDWGGVELATELASRGPLGNSNFPLSGDPFAAIEFTFSAKKFISFRFAMTRHRLKSPNRSPVPWIQLAGLLVAATYWQNPLFALSPLITDDADTVPRGRLQLVTGLTFSHSDAVDGWSTPVTPTVGLTDSWEAGLSFGYQWQSTSAGVDSFNASGVLDTVITTKWKWFDQTNQFATLSTRLSVKIPTAPPSESIGTGKTDVGALLIATKSFGATSFDFNLGYTFLDPWGSGVGDDQLFVGQTARHSFGERWVVMGEVFGLLPISESSNGTANFNVGFQFFITPSIDLEAAVLQTIGGASNSTSGYIGLTWVF